MVFCVITIWAMPASRQLYFLPEHISLDLGETISVQLGFPLTIEIQNNEIAETQIETTGMRAFGTSEVQLTAHQEGETQITMSLLGIPVRRMNVKVGQERYVIPGGQSIGVKLDAKGVLVVSCGEVVDYEGISHEPAKQAGLKSGEMISEVNGIAIKDANHLTELINESAEDIIKGLNSPFEKEGYIIEIVHKSNVQEVQ